MPIDTRDTRDTSATRSIEERALILAPEGRDGQVIANVLANHGLGALTCDSTLTLVEALRQGAGSSFVTEEALGQDLDLLRHWIDQQPPWSDFPFTVLVARRSGRRPTRALDTLNALGNVVLLERPLNAETLLTAARSALRARQRQYRGRQHLLAVEQAHRAEEAARDDAVRARLEAEAAGRMKDEFLATLSHELRTPLSAILGWTHLLLRPDTKVDIARGVSIIERNARAQARLIEELLDVSRITSGKVELDRQAVSVPRLLDTALQSIGPAAEAKQVDVAIECDSWAGDVHADADRLQQVLWNLVSNAVKFTPPGGRVRLGCRQLGDNVELFVKDSGVGMPASFVPHAFERFRQAEASESRSYGGLGLGLAIVRELVALHGGSVEAHSDGQGLGATFVVRLPSTRPGAEDVVDRSIRSAAVASHDTASGAARDALAGIRVLVVDDEVDGREMIAALLEGVGAQVQTAASAHEALERLALAPPDVLVSDIGLPKVDGYELMRRIKAAGGDARRLPAIALTAFARAEDSDKAHAAGFSLHLAKPFEPAVLVRSIASIALVKAA